MVRREQWLMSEAFKELNDPSLAPDLCYLVCLETVH